jgi:hypothetical protein
MSLYRVSQEERSIFWEVIVLAILNKKVCMYMYHILNGFQGRAVSLYSSLDVHQDALRGATRHVLARAAKCIDIDCGRKCIIAGKLYQLCHLNNKYWC